LGRLHKAILKTSRISASAVARPNAPACPLPAINPADAKSPLRWLGNKDPDWKRISPYIQLAKGGSFFEPFGGSAATTFRVLAREGRPITVHIAERVPELRAVIEAIRDNPGGFLKRLPRGRCPERYKAWRAILQCGDWKGIDPLTRTVMWFYVKKNAHRAHAGWSGYFGDPSRPNGCYIFDRIAAQLNFFSPLLQNTTLYSDFRDLPTPKAGDFVFLDPPYTGSDNRACYGMTEVENDETMTLAQDAYDWVVGSKANFLFVNRLSPELLDWVGDRTGLLRKRRSPVVSAGKLWTRDGITAEKVAWFNKGGKQNDFELYVSRSGRETA
jgi:site-specific DNA-adenine methylase